MKRKIHLHHHHQLNLLLLFVLNLALLSNYVREEKLIQIVSKFNAQQIRIIQTSKIMEMEISFLLSIQLELEAQVNLLLKVKNLQRFQLITFQNST